MKPALPKPGLLLGLAGFLFGAALLAPQPAAALDPVPTYKKWIDPNAVSADTGFRLKLFSTEFSCATSFTRLNVQVDGSRLFLTYYPKHGISAICNQSGPFGPTFEVPALKAGAYSVEEIRLVDCEVAGTCAVKRIPQVVDTLVVRPSQPEPVSQYSLLPAAVKANTAFTLSLAHSSFVCGTRLSRLTSMLGEGNTLELGYVAEGPADTAAPCQNVKAVTADYKVEGLKPGVYTVYATRNFACQYSAPYCKIKSIREKAGTLTVSEETRPEGWFIAPDRVPADSAFTLKLLRWAQDCGVTYSHLKAAFDGGALRLSFVRNQRNDIVCAAVMPTHPVGPEFKVEPLKPGRYPVYASQLLPCQVATPACKIAEIPVLVDTLVVERRGGGMAAWFLKPAEAEANKAFKLQVLSNDYGNCQTGFSLLHDTLIGGTLHLRAKADHYPDRVCITDIRPHGPTYEIGPLPPGRYPVQLYEHPSCHPCKMMGKTTTVDTLVVKGAAAPPSRYLLDPPQVVENKAFSLNLLSHDFHCPFTASYLKAHVEGGKILLNFVGKDNPAIKCARPSGCAPEMSSCMAKPAPLTFNLKGLAAGLYPVYASHLSSCMVCPEGVKDCAVCDMYVEPVFVGNLRVNPSYMHPYAQVLPDTVKAGAPFDLTLVSHAIGCNSQITEAKVEVVGQDIRLSYRDNPDKTRPCPAVIMPYKQVFKAPALIPSWYRVLVSVQGGDFEAVDALEVAVASSAIAPAGRRAGEKIGVTGAKGMLAITGLRLGTAFSASLYSLEGRFLADLKEGQKLAGDRVLLPLPSGLRKGLYTVKLTDHRGSVSLRRVHLLD